MFIFNQDGSSSKRTWERKPPRLSARSPSTIPTNRGGRSNKRIVATVNRAERACLEPSIPAKTTRLVRFTLAGIHPVITYRFRPAQIYSSSHPFPVAKNILTMSAELASIFMLGRLRGSVSPVPCSRREGTDSIKRDHVSKSNSSGSSEPLRAELASMLSQSTMRCWAAQRIPHCCCYCVEGLLT
jgi:hypothetical protein